MRLELTHDIIALKIWEQLPERDKQVRLIRNSFYQRYADFTQGEGSLLGEKELSAWEEFFPLLNLNKENQDYIQLSKSQVEKNKTRKRLINIGLILLTVLAIITSLVAFYSGIRANKNADLALNAEQKARIAQEEAEQLSTDILTAFEDLANKDYELKYAQALEAYEKPEQIEFAAQYAQKALAVIDSYTQKLKERKVSTAVIEKFRNAIDNNGAKAKAFQLKLGEELADFPKYTAFYNQGFQAEKAKNYVDAYNYFLKAKKQANTSIIKKCINRVVTNGYNYYLKKGMGHLEDSTVEDIKLALKYFKQAQQLKNTTEIQKEIAQLQ